MYLFNLLAVNSEVLKDTEDKESKETKKIDIISLNSLSKKTRNTNTENKESISGASNACFKTTSQIYSKNNNSSSSFLQPQQQPKSCKKSMDIKNSSNLKGIEIQGIQPEPKLNEKIIINNLSSNGNSNKMIYNRTMNTREEILSQNLNPNANQTVSINNNNMTETSGNGDKSRNNPMLNYTFNKTSSGVTAVKRNSTKVNTK